jgi:hypothetical protein
MVAVLLSVSGVLGQDRVPGPVEVLVVAELDKPNGRILFEARGVVTRNIEQGKAVSIKVGVPMKVAFSLKDGRAITADGKAVKEADLWKQIEVGKPVVILSPEARGSDQAIRALFKDDTILLVGVTTPLPKGEASPKKP